MITLSLHDESWVKGDQDDPADHCAHSRVEFRVTDTSFVKPEDGDWTVSAAALYLLRTFSFDHLSTDSVAEYNFFFPCCGFSVLRVKGRFEAYCMGCPNGVDVEVTHEAGEVRLSSPAGAETVSEQQRKNAVLSFAQQVRSFYQRSSPKAKIRDRHERCGWAAFWREWEARASAANSTP